MNKKILIAAGFFLFIFLNNTKAQTETKIVSDTTVVEIVAVKAADVPVASGELISNLMKIKENTPDTKKIKKYALKNDSLIMLTDSLLTEDKITDLNSQTTRYLSNRITFWKKFAEEYNNFNRRLTDDVSVLDNYKKRLNKDIAKWKKTNANIKAEDPGSGLLPRLKRVLQVLDSTQGSLSQKSDDILIILNKATEKGFDIETQISSIDGILIEKKKQIFVQNEPSLFSSEYWNKCSKSFSTPIINFYNTEIRDGYEFLSMRTPIVIFQILLIIIFLLIFRALSRKLKNEEYDTESTYRKFLVKIVKRGVSASVLIAIFISLIVFPTNPEVIKDMMMLIISVPIVIIAKTFINNKFHKYLNVFWVVVVINVIYIIFPPDNIFYSILLFTISVLEIYILWKLFWYFYKRESMKSFINIVVVLLLVISFGFAVVGFVGLIFGSTTLAELSLNMPVFTAFSGLLIFISMIILNGLISFLLETSYVTKLNVIRIYGNIIKKRTLALVNLFLMLIWFSSILNMLNIRREFLDWISSVLNYEIVLGSASFTTSDILLFFLVIYISVLLSRIIMILLEQDVLSKVKLAKGLPHTIAVMVRYAIISIGIFLAITAVGMPMSNLTVIIGAMGVGIGFGLQNIFNNLVSGFILLFERPIQIDDTIEVGDLVGKVKSIGIRASNIRTFDGADIIVPNGDLVSNQVVNWTLSDQQRRIEVLAGVAYGSDPHKVKELFEKVLSEHKDILNDPAPNVFFNGLGDSSLDFRLLFWTSNFTEWLRIKSDIVFGVHDILYKEGISIPFPQMDLHLKSIETALEISKKTNK